MRYSQVCLESWGYVLPEKVLTSLEIEKQLSPLCKKFSLPSGFFEIFTGIKERRVWEKETLPSHMSTLAAQKALTKENLKNTDIDYLLHVSVSRDYLEPATAATVHHELGLSPQASYFDISNACLGFLNGILVHKSLNAWQPVTAFVTADREKVDDYIEILVAQNKLVKSQCEVGCVAQINIVFYLRAFHAVFVRALIGKINAG